MGAEAHAARAKLSKGRLGRRAARPSEAKLTTKASAQRRSAAPAQKRLHKPPPTRTRSVDSAQYTKQHGCDGSTPKARNAFQLFYAESLRKHDVSNSTEASEKWRDLDAEKQSKWQHAALMENGCNLTTSVALV